MILWIISDYLIHQVERAPECHTMFAAVETKKKWKRNNLFYRLRLFRATEVDVQTRANSRNRRLRKRKWESGTIRSLGFRPMFDSGEQKSSTSGREIGSLVLGEHRSRDRAQDRVSDTRGLQSSDRNERRRKSDSVVDYEPPRRMGKFYVKSKLKDQNKNNRKIIFCHFIIK